MTLHADLIATIPADEWTRTQVSDVELNAKAGTGEWLTQYDRVYIGGGSITIADTKEKLVTWRTWPVTGGELARAYLKVVFAPDHAPMGANPTNVGFRARAPLYCEPVRHRALAYVDITSAYHQLLVPYRPDDMPLGRSVNAGTLSWWREDEMAATRNLRHSVAGSMWSNSIEWCERGTWERAPACSRWSNPWMKRRVMHTLHAVVFDLMAKVQVYAWLTDAAIVDATDADVVLDVLANRWCLSARVVAVGMGAVWNMTSYAVGEKKSQGILNGRIPTTDAPFTNLVVPEEGVSWLADERQRAAGG